MAQAESIHASSYWESVADESARKTSLAPFDYSEISPDPHVSPGQLDLKLPEDDSQKLKSTNGSLIDRLRTGIRRRSSSIVLASSFITNVGVPPLDRAMLPSEITFASQLVDANSMHHQEIIPRSEIESYQPKPPWRGMAYYGPWSDRAIKSKNIVDGFKPFNGVSFGEEDFKAVVRDMGEMTYARFHFALTSLDKGWREKFLRWVLTEVMPSPDNPYPLFKWAGLGENNGYRSQSWRKDVKDIDKHYQDLLDSPWYLKDEEEKPLWFPYSSASDRAKYLNKMAKVQDARGLRIYAKGFTLQEIHRDPIITLPLPVPFSSLSQFKNPFYEESYDQLRIWDYQPVYPAQATDHAYMVSPEFSRFNVDGDLRVRPRNLVEFRQNLVKMKLSGKEIQLIISFNEEPEKTRVKSVSKDQDKRRFSDSCPSPYAPPPPELVRDYTELEIIRSVFDPIPVVESLPPKEVTIYPGSPYKRAA